jgi:hypothetical protein
MHGQSGYLNETPRTTYAVMIQIKIAHAE